LSALLSLNCTGISNIQAVANAGFEARVVQVGKKDYPPTKEKKIIKKDAMTCFSSCFNSSIQ